MKLKLLAASILVLCTTLPSQAASLRLGWNPSPDRSVVGYKIHYGRRPGKYTHVVQVKGRRRTQAVINGLEKGRTYFFAVTAYNKKGQESPFSSEISGKAGGKTPKNHNRATAAPRPAHHEPHRPKIAPKRTLKTDPAGKLLPAR